MSHRRALLSTLTLCAVAALALPTAAAAHAYLTKTVPAASVELESPPPSVALTFDEAVEPRFAVISVTDVDAHQVTDGTVSRSPANPDTLVVPLKRVSRGWYLVYWRAISVDGHPVQGAFTFAVGPNPGPPPLFVIPHIAQTATSTPLLVARWIAFLTVMTAIGLLVLRLLIARPLVSRVTETSLRAVSLAFFCVSAVAAVALPAYLEESAAIDSLRSFFSFGALIPLWRTTAFGRGWFDVWICFLLFVLASAVAIGTDRPERADRSIAALVALPGALVAAAAVLVLPGVSGHAGQTSPRGLAVLLDWLHLVSASVWLGGLVGLLVLWWTLPRARRLAGLAVCVPRFSNVAFLSVLILLGSGVWASILHLPVLDALWLTSYGKVILVKSAILLATLPLAATNLLRNKPGLAAADAARSASAARLLRLFVGSEAVLVAGAVFAAALLSSLAPPPPAFARENSALARVGPGPTTSTVHVGSYTVKLSVAPNKATQENAFQLQLTKGGKPVRDAEVTVQFNMLDMQMPQQEYGLAETSPGVYTRRAAPLVMVGHWGLTFDVTPKQGPPFAGTIVDRANG
jgi:copper transport protein